MSTAKENPERHAWWNDLRHQGVIISLPVLGEYFPSLETPTWFDYATLRERFNKFETWLEESLARDRDNEVLIHWCDTVFEGLLKYPRDHLRKGNDIPDSATVTGLTGQKIRPNRLLYQGPERDQPLLAIFIERPIKGDDEYRLLGTGRGRLAYSRLLEYLRGTSTKLGLLTNGLQFRLCYAGSDHDSWCEWDARSWFEEEELRAQLNGFLTLLGKSGIAPRVNHKFPLLNAIESSRSKQAELASVMGEQVRTAVELLIEQLNAAKARFPELLEPVYADPKGTRPTPKQVRDAVNQAATRLIMRIVVVLFAEARGLLQRSQLVYEQSYGVEGLFGQLRKAEFNEGRSALEQRFYGWYRLCALFRLIHDGCHHPDLNIQQYGGILFRTGAVESDDIVLRAMSVFEGERYSVSDRVILTILERLKIGRVKVKQGRTSVVVAGPVDFADLKTEFIGMMYEGILDFELRAAEEPLVILNLGREPILPLTLLENKNTRELKDLITKLSKEKAKSSVEGSEDEEEEADSAEEDADSLDGGIDEGSSEPDDPDSGQPEPADALDEGDHRRVRAVEWAMRAAETAGLVRRKRSEDDYYYQQRLNQAAQQLIIKVLDKDEFYLARWGGTRKGTGTFYTKPGLAIPTTRRTLHPLLYNDTGAASQPRTPEEILGLRVCDPSCGSASFLVAALHLITDALYKSLVVHRQITDETAKRVLTLPFGQPSSGGASEDVIPLPPSDEHFEDTVRSRLRRYVVERCLYGVDLNPMAVELARLSLWIETMDPKLPFGFLDHKIKVGTSLIGCWFDRFAHYPLAAWLRDGGNEQQTEIIQDQIKGPKGNNKRRPGEGTVTMELRALILHGAGVETFAFQKEDIDPEAVQNQAGVALEEIHDLSIADPEIREQTYLKRFLGNKHYASLKAAFDAWCSVWFWPVDRFDEALPSPRWIVNPDDRIRRVAAELAAKHYFFHWELEYPDVFTSESSGFDAIIGNPPWETMQPNSKEFFSNYDPIYRTYGKQEALSRQREMFEANPSIEREWTDYNAFYKSFSNWMDNAASPFGGPDNSTGHRVALSKTRAENTSLHDTWEDQRASTARYFGGTHPFLWQGTGKVYTYKMFLELSHALLKRGGRLGMIVPSGIYTDNGTIALRELFAEKSSWEWLFGFENQRQIFDIHRSFKFCPLIVQKAGQTEAISTAFMRHELSDWDERAEQLSTPYEKSKITIFSPKSKALLELRSKRDIEIVEKMYANSVLLGDQSEEGWGIQYRQGDFNMTSDSHLFHSRPWWEERGYRPDPYGRWIGPEGDMALPLYEGRMIDQFDFSAKGWVSGKGRSAKWREIDWLKKVYEPQYLMHEDDFKENCDRSGLLRKLGFMDASSSTNTRTMIASLCPDYPLGHKVPLFSVRARSDADLLLLPVLNSFAYDFALRTRHGGLSISYFIAEETSIPSLRGIPQAASKVTSEFVLRLNAANEVFAPSWLVWQNRAASQSSWQSMWAITPRERRRLACILDAVVTHLYGLDSHDIAWILRNDKEDPKGFWRVDKGSPEELRQPSLTLLAFERLSEVGVDAFLAEDWDFPEEIATRLGPRYLEWQQPNATEAEVAASWQECEQHAKNILGPRGFALLLNSLKEGDADTGRTKPPDEEQSKSTQQRFELK